MALFSPFSMGGLFSGLVAGRQEQENLGIAQQNADTLQRQALNAAALPAKVLAANAAQRILGAITDPERFATIRDQGLMPFLTDAVQGLGLTAQTGDWSHVTALDGDSFQKLMRAAGGAPATAPTTSPGPGLPDQSGTAPAGTPAGLPGGIPSRPLTREELNQIIEGGGSLSLPTALTAPGSLEGLENVPDTSRAVPISIPDVSQLFQFGLGPGSGPATPEPAAATFSVSDLFQQPELRAIEPGMGGLASPPAAGTPGTPAPSLRAGVPPPDPRQVLPPSVALQSGQDIYNQVLGYTQLPENLKQMLGNAPPGSVQVDLTPRLDQPPAGGTGAGAVQQPRRSPAQNGQPGTATRSGSSLPDAATTAITADPTNPLNGAIAALSTKVQSVVASLPTLDAATATKYSKEYVANIIHDPGYLNATTAYNQAVAAGGYSPTMLSALNDQRQAALAKAAAAAQLTLTGELSPYISSAQIAKDTAAGLKDLGDTVNSLGTTVGSVTTAALAPGAQDIERTKANAEVTKAGAAVTSAQAAQQQAETAANTQAETARHNAAQEDIDQAKPIIDRIQARLSMRDMTGGSWTFNFGGGASAAGLASASARYGQGESQRQAAARANTRNQISDILALRTLGLQGNNYAGAVAEGYLQAARAEYFADPASWSTIPPTDQILRGLDYLSMDPDQAAAVRRQVGSNTAAAQRLAEDVSAGTAWQKQMQIHFYGGPRYVPDTGLGNKKTGGSGDDGKKPPASSTPGAGPLGGTGSFTGGVLDSLMRPIGTPDGLPPPPGGWDAYWQLYPGSRFSPTAGFNADVYNKAIGRKK